MASLRIGMIVPSLNTIAEDDFRRFCPPEVGFYVHRVRLRTEPGRVTVDDLVRANGEADAAGAVLADLKPSAIAFNCTGASVAPGPTADAELAARMSASLGIATTNTMVEIKHALSRLGARSVVHVCPFAGDSSEIERRALEAGEIKVLKSVALGFADARTAAGMTPEEITQLAAQHDRPEADAMLLSCANVRALEAADMVEQKLGKPVVTSNGAMLWGVLRLAGYSAPLEGGGSLLRL